jgi:hypothetical protein
METIPISEDVTEPPRPETVQVKAGSGSPAHFSKVPAVIVAVALLIVSW